MKLYLIKKFNFDKDKLKNEFNIEIELLQYYDEQNSEIKLDNVSYDFQTSSRMFEFKDGKSVIKKFIFDSEHLSRVIEDLKFKPFTYEKEEMSLDSLKSENSDEEINFIFNNISITLLKKVKINISKILEKFNKRYVEKQKYIKDLSLNSSFYYPNNKNDSIDFSFFNEYKEKIKDFFFLQNIKILYLFGPKGTSKSLFLIHKIFKENYYNKYPLLYINYRVLKNLKIEKRNNIFKKEMIYLFFDENKLKDFVFQQKFYQKIKNNKLMIFLYDFIKYLIGIYKNYFENAIIVVIDNFDEDNQEEIKYIEDIINLVIKEDLVDKHLKIKLILSGRCKFIYNKLFKCLKNRLLEKSIINNEMFIYYNKELNKNNYINSLPLYHFRIKKGDKKEYIKEAIINEEIEFCKKYNLYGMYYSLLYNEKIIKISDLEKYYEILPIDYLVFKEFKTDEIIFKFHNEISKSAIKIRIEDSIKADAYKYLLNDSNRDAITYGIFEEKLLILIFSYNKLKLIDLFFYEENKFEIEEINKFKDSFFEKTEQNYKKRKPILITQKNFLGKNYDLLILIPTLNENTYKAYLIQIGKNKTKAYIEKIINELEGDNNSIKKGIEKFIDCFISKIELVFIFDMQTQIDVINNGSFSGAQYCFDNNILFYIFSLDDYLLHYTLDMIEFPIVINFNNQINKIKYIKFLSNDIQGKNRKSKTRTYNVLDAISDDSQELLHLFNLGEIKKIESIVKIKIFENFAVDKTLLNQKINDLKDCDKNYIYVYDQGNNRYYIIEKKYYAKNGEDIENITKKKVPKDNNFKLNIIIPKISNNFKKNFKDK